MYRNTTAAEYMGDVLAAGVHGIDRMDGWMDRWIDV